MNPKPLPSSVFHLLLALRAGEQHGYGLMHRVEDLTGGDVRMGPGTLYGSIKRMLADGLIEEADERPDPTLDDQRRRYYRITAEGERACAGEVARIETLLRNARRASPKFGARRMSGERLYRSLLLLYPRRFRREYRAQMVQLFRDQRRDRGRGAWLTTFRDLFATVPVQHTEAFMHLSPQGKLLSAAMVTTIGIAVFAAVGGAYGAIILMLLLVWILTTVLRGRGAIPSRSFWWKLVVAGVGLFALTFVVFAPPWPQSWRDAVPGDLAWSVGFSAFVTSMVLVATGLLTGLVQHAGRRHAAG